MLGAWRSGLTGLRVTTRTVCCAIVFPVAVVVELLGAFPRVPRWLVWPLRLAVVAGGARVLLHGTSYITDLAGPGTSEWSPSLAWLIFAGLAALEAAVWALLSLLARRAPGLSLPVCLAGATRRRGGDGHALWLCHGRTNRVAARGGSHGRGGVGAGADAQSATRRARSASRSLGFSACS